TTTAKFIRGRPVAFLSSYIDRIPGMPPVFDETGIHENIAVSFTDPLPGDLGPLNKQLAGYGLQVRQARRKLDMIIVSRSADTQPIYSPNPKQP
ncbi:MAG: hypothetical protein ACTHJ8_11510, partial [Mucilaginibacter sp.]